MTQEDSLEEGLKASEAAKEVRLLVDMSNIHKNNTRYTLNSIRVGDTTPTQHGVAHIRYTYNHNGKRMLFTWNFDQNDPMLVIDLDTNMVIDKPSVSISDSTPVTSVPYAFINNCAAWLIVNGHKSSRAKAIDEMDVPRPPRPVPTDAELM